MTISPGAYCYEDSATANARVVWSLWLTAVSSFIRYVTKQVTI